MRQFATLLTHSFQQPSNLLQLVSLITLEWNLERPSFIAKCRKEHGFVRMLSMYSNTPFAVYYGDHKELERGECHVAQTKASSFQ